MINLLRAILLLVLILYAVVSWYMAYTGYQDFKQIREEYRQMMRQRKGQG